MIVLEPNRSAIVDTNVLVYAHQSSDEKKHAIANELIDQLTMSSRLIVTTQIINEFAVTCLSSKKKEPLSAPVVQELVHMITVFSRVLVVNPETTILALGAVDKHRMSFWDALIWSTAKLNSIDIIYTEDTQSSENIEGVKYINPFEIISGI